MSKVRVMPGPRAKLGEDDETVFRRYTLYRVARRRHRARVEKHISSIFPGSRSVTSEGPDGKPGIFFIIYIPEEGRLGPACEDRNCPFCGNRYLDAAAWFLDRVASRTANVRRSGGKWLRGVTLRLPAKALGEPPQEIEVHDAIYRRTSWDSPTASYKLHKAGS